MSIPAYCLKCPYSDCLDPCPIEMNKKMEGLTPSQQYNARYYLKNREKLKAKKQEYRKKYPEKIKEINRRYRERMKGGE